MRDRGKGQRWEVRGWRNWPPLSIGEEDAGRRRRRREGEREREGRE